MAYNRNQARALCTAGEYALFEASLGDRIGEHTPAQLRTKIKRARALRDKYRDLFKRQRLANRERTGTKKGQRADSNARTEQKARLFDEVLTRFERRADEAQPEPGRGGTTRRTKKTARSKTRPATASRRKAQATKAPAEDAAGKKAHAEKTPAGKARSSKTPRSESARSETPRSETARAEAAAAEGAPSAAAAEAGQASGAEAGQASGAGAVKADTRKAGAAAASGRKPKGGKAGVAAKPSGAGDSGAVAGRAGFVSEAARGAGRRQRLQQTRSKAVQGHTRAAGRRAQARRDSRN